MSELATVEHSEVDGVAVARVAGEVDASNARAIGSRLTEALPNVAMGLVLDLTDTTYIDSAGVQLLFDVGGRLRQRQQELRVVYRPESFVSDVIAAVALAAIAELDESVPTAVAALKAAR